MKIIILPSAYPVDKYSRFCLTAITFPSTQTSGCAKNKYRHCTTRENTKQTHWRCRPMRLQNSCTDEMIDHPHKNPYYMLYMCHLIPGIGSFASLASVVFIFIRNRPALCRRFCCGLPAHLFAALFAQVVQHKGTYPKKDHHPMIPNIQNSVVVKIIFGLPDLFYPRPC